MKPLAIDLFCGLGGWAEGLMLEGFFVVGFDIERHVYGDEKYPGELVLQDVRTLHGSQFKDAALIVASPPCQAYSYRAMPWKRAKALPPPDNELFDTCFRIQREACEAAGHHIPMVVENVRGAQKWVGRSRWNFGSFHLWGDVPALMPSTINRREQNSGARPPAKHAMVCDCQCPEPLSGPAMISMECPIHNWNPSQPPEGMKVGGRWWNDRDNRYPPILMMSSKSPARARASAMIAKIPLPLARHIGRVYAP